MGLKQAIRARESNPGPKNISCWMGRMWTPSAAPVCGAISRSNLTGCARRLPRPRRRLLRPRRRAPRLQPRSLRPPLVRRRQPNPQRPRHQRRPAPRACCVHMGSRNPLCILVFRAVSPVQMLLSERVKLLSRVSSLSARRKPRHNRGTKPSLGSAACPIVPIRRSSAANPA